MRFKKKGSLSLSINAIVILVLAISMLGLGLGFTKNMFAKFGSKLDVPAPSIPATEDEPITVESENLQAKIGKSFSFGYNIYNKGTEPDNAVDPDVTCDPTIAVATAAGSINAQTFAPFKALIDATNAPTTSTAYLCTITVDVASGTYTKQITIQYT